MVRVLIDLFCGLGGASEAFCGEDGWKVIRIDNNPDLLDHVKGMWLLDMMKPHEVWSVIHNHLYDLQPESVFIWASPPCTDFSTKNVDRKQHADNGFDLDLLKNTQIVIDVVGRHYNLTGFIIENVKGAVGPFNEVLGPYLQRIGPFFLWGRFVPIACITADVHKHRKPFNKTNSRTPLRSNIHAKIPYALSESLRLTLDRQLSLLRWVE